MFTPDNFPQVTPNDSIQIHANMFEPYWRDYISKEILNMPLLQASPYEYSDGRYDCSYGRTSIEEISEWIVNKTYKGLTGPIETLVHPVEFVDLGGME